jgi:hypothetical protein
MTSARITVVVIAMLVAACAARTKGEADLSHEKDTIALRVANESSEQIAQLIKDQGVEVAIISSNKDSAWFADVATRAGLKSSRPGRAGNSVFAFIGPTAIGDTTLSLKVAGGGEIRVHDALYRIDKNRRLDLLAVKVEPGVNLTESMKSLLQYVSTDVMANAAVILAIEPPNPIVGDSIAVLIRPVYADAWECTRAGRDRTQNRELPIRLFYGPGVRIRCKGADRLDAGGGSLLARLELS